MSLSGTQKNYGGPPNGYPYPDDRGESSRMAQPLPTLPPMASLLRRDQEEPPALQQPYPHNPFVARQFQPPYNMVKHAAWPITPTQEETLPQPFYPPPRPMSPDHTEQQTPSSPVFPPQHTLALPLSQGQPLVQRRQIKKITQRRMDYLKERQSQPPQPTNSVYLSDSKRSTPSPFQHPEPAQRQVPPAPYQQEPSPYSRRESGQSERSSMPKRQMSSQNHSSAGQPSRSMPISNLLSSGPSPSIPLPPTPEYSIHMRQQPLAARACGFGERDRRVIDPPPILQMTVSCPGASQSELSTLLRQPYAVVHCTLWDPHSDTDDTAMPSSTASRQQRRLMGTLVASPFVGLDEHNVEGCFFCFPDLSVRTPGTYSLKFSLVNLDPSRMRPGMSEPVRSTVKSSIFHVYNAKDFGGMRASTALTKSLKHQGCLISVKKGNAKSNSRKEDDGDDEDEDEDEDRGVNEGRNRGAKKSKR